MIVSTTAGTGYDTYARAVARHLPRHMPGQSRRSSCRTCRAPAVITAANHIYSVAPQDGTVFGMIQNTVPFEPLIENAAARFDPMKMNWLGTPTTEVGLYIVYHTAKVQDAAGRAGARDHRRHDRHGLDAGLLRAAVQPDPADQDQADRRLSRTARAAAVDGTGRDQRDDLAVLVEPEGAAARAGIRRRSISIRSSMARRRIPSSRTCRSRWIWWRTPPTSFC